MKIAYIGDATSIHITEWANHFLKTGHEVHIISDNPNKINRIKIHNIGQCLYRPPLPIISATIQIIVKIWKIRKLVKQIKPDIIHAHYATNYGFLASFIRGYPLVLTCHGSDILIDYDKSILNKYFINQAIKKAKVITVPSNYMKDIITDKINKTPPIVKFQYGIYLHKFSYSFNIKYPIKCISTRKLENKYRIDILIDAVNKLDKNLNAEFLIIGSGRDEEVLKNKVKKLRLENKIKFEGEVKHDNISEYYKMAHLYVTTSPSDGLSISLLEAFASGCYPIVPDIPANRELLKEGFKLKLYEVGNSTSLSHALSDTIEKIFSLTEETRLNRKLVEKLYNREINMKQMETIYQRLQIR